VLAGDIDPVSVRVARHNARLNHADALVEIIHANGLSDRRVQARGPFDLVFANILLGPLKRLANPIRQVAAPGASVVVSGLLSSQANAALATYRGLSLVLERRISLDGWVTLVLTRPATQTVRRAWRIDLTPLRQKSFRGAAKRRARNPWPRLRGYGFRARVLRTRPGMTPTINL
jgi:ribosomal protein L11 methyltransferase